MRNNDYEPRTQYCITANFNDFRTLEALLATKPYAVPIHSEPSVFVYGPDEITKSPNPLRTAMQFLTGSNSARLDFAPTFSDTNVKEIELTEAYQLRTHTSLNAHRAALAVPLYKLTDEYIVALILLIKHGIPKAQVRLYSTEIFINLVCGYEQVISQGGCQTSEVNTIKFLLQPSEFLTKPIQDFIEPKKVVNNYESLLESQLDILYNYNMFLGDLADGAGRQSLNVYHYSNGYIAKDINGPVLDDNVYYVDLDGCKSTLNATFVTSLLFATAYAYRWQQLDEPTLALLLCSVNGLVFSQEREHLLKQVETLYNFYDTYLNTDSTYYSKRLSSLLREHSIRLVFGLGSLLDSPEAVSSVANIIKCHVKSSDYINLVVLNDNDFNQLPLDMSSVYSKSVKYVVYSGLEYQPYKHYLIVHSEYTQIRKKIELVANNLNTETIAKSLMKALKEQSNEQA